MDTKRSAVTLVEILIVCVIISITVGLATAGFRTLVEQERQNVCDYNQLILYKAMQLYASDHDVYPSSLSSLVPGYATQALACLKAEKAFPPRVIALRVLQWFEPQEAVAQSLRNYYGGDVRVITCPADTTPPASGGVSYGLNQTVINKNPGSVSASTIVIADSDAATFTTAGSTAHRHRNHVFSARTFSIGTNNGGNHYINKSGKGSWETWRKRNSCQ